jgi:hypothetical protein
MRETQLKCMKESNGVQSERQITRDEEPQMRERVLVAIMNAQSDFQMGAATYNEDSILTTSSVVKTFA